MLNADQISALRDAAGHIADPITEYLLRDIARRVSEAGQLTSTAAYQTWRAQQLGMSQKEIKKALQKLLKKSAEEIDRLMTQTAKVGYDFDVQRLPTAAAIPFDDNLSIQKVVRAAVELAQEDFTNLTKTIGMVDRSGVALPLQKAYRAAMDDAFEQVFTGAADYNTAIRKATANLATFGLRVVDYESNIHRSIEAATRGCIMGGLGLMDERIAQIEHDQLGCDGWEISAHANSAPDHEPIQGRQYSDDAYQNLNNSLQRRIGTLNCGHVAFPIILGVSKPQYAPEELEKFRQDNAEGFTYGGKHYTGYEATQHQRKLERRMRAQKHRILVDEGTGDAEKLQQDQIKLQITRQEYARFSKAAGLRTEPERAQVAGFGRGQAARARNALEKSAGSGIMKSSTNDVLPISDQTIANLPTVTGGILDAASAARLRDQMQETLDIARGYEPGTEVGILCDMSGNRIGSPYVGKGGANHVHIPEPQQFAIAVHNHPDGRTFSHPDLARLIESGNIRMAVAVGHNSTVFTLAKSISYDALGYFKFFRKRKTTLDRLIALNDEEGYVKAMDAILQEGKRYGLIYQRTGSQGT